MFKTFPRFNLDNLKYDVMYYVKHCELKYRHNKGFRYRASVNSRDDLQCKMTTNRKYCLHMPNRENNVCRSGNVWKAIENVQETNRNIVRAPPKCSGISWEFLASRGANFVSAKMFHEVGKQGSIIYLRMPTSHRY